MDELSPDIINVILTPASHAALAGGILAIVMIITRRLVNGKLTVKWERFMVKIAAVVGAMASGLISVQQDTMDDVLRPILNALIIVGLSVGLYRYAGDLLFKKVKESLADLIDNKKEELSDLVDAKDEEDRLSDLVEEEEDRLEDTSPETPLPKAISRGE